jgi:hypothetical protein
VFSDAEHRFCLRHLHANFSYADFRGPLLKQLMDKAAYAYKEYDFQQAMDEIKRVNGNAFKWLSDIDSKHWSRHNLVQMPKLTWLLITLMSHTMLGF